jgi:hypothetical protein
LCWLAALTCVLAACAHSSFSPIDLKTLPTAKKYPNDHVVYLIDEQTVRFGRDGSAPDAYAESETHVQAKLLRGRMPEAASVAYSRTFSKITAVEARVVLPDGTSHDADPEKQRDTPAFQSSVLFSDQRVLTLETPEVPIDGVRELRVVERFTDVRPWLFDFTFGNTDPTELARLTVEYPSAWEIDLVVEPGIERHDEEKGGLKRVVLEAAKVPGFREEANGLPALHALPRAFVRLKSWISAAGPEHAFADDKAMSAWLDQKYAATGLKDPELQRTVGTVLEGASADPAERARKLYEYVSKHVEYCAVEIGYGGWIPHAALEVQKNRYGDCKDKANYLHALMEAAGIPSQVAIVHSHSGFPNKLVLPTLGATFNHAILAVKLPAGEVYVDPTERTVPFGLLPARDCESPALQLSATGEALGHTPAFGPERSGEDQRFVLTVDANGTATGTFALAGKGIDASELKIELLRGGLKQNELLEHWLDLRSLHVTAVDKTDLPDFEDRATVEGKLVAERLIARSGTDVTLIRLDSFAPRWLPTLNPDARRTPFAYRWLRTLTGEVELQLPPGARASAVPPPVSFDNPFFHYELKWEATGSKVVVHRSMVRKLRTIEPAQFEKFRAAVTEALVADARAAVVRFEGTR